MPRLEDEQVCPSSSSPIEGRRQREPTLSELWFLICQSVWVEIRPMPPIEHLGRHLERSRTTPCTPHVSCQYGYNYGWHQTFLPVIVFFFFFFK